MGILWIVAGRRLTLLIDSLWTWPAESLRVASLSVSSGSIHVGNTTLETRGEFAPYIANGKAAFDWRDRSVVLGAAQPDADNRNSVTPEDGDEATLRISHSVLIWPTPLDLNFMTGVSPSWRYRYYRLAWRKRSGETLRVNWRYEQWRYSRGWSGDMHSLHPTGLIAVDFTGK